MHPLISFSSVERENESWGNPLHFTWFSCRGPSLFSEFSLHFYLFLSLSSISTWYHTLWSMNGMRSWRRERRWWWWLWWGEWDVGWFGWWKDTEEKRVRWAKERENREERGALDGKLNCNQDENEWINQDKTRERGKGRGKKREEEMRARLLSLLLPLYLREKRRTHRSLPDRAGLEGEKFVICSSLGRPFPLIFSFEKKRHLLLLFASSKTDHVSRSRRENREKSDPSHQEKEKDDEEVTCSWFFRPRIYWYFLVLVCLLFPSFRRHLITATVA